MLWCVCCVYNLLFKKSKTGTGSGQSAFQVCQQLSTYPSMNVMTEVQSAWTIPSSQLPWFNWTQYGHVHFICGWEGGVNSISSTDLTGGQFFLFWWSFGSDGMRVKCRYCLHSGRKQGRRSQTDNTLCPVLITVLVYNQNPCIDSDAGPQGVMGWVGDGFWGRDPTIAQTTLSARSASRIVNSRYNTQSFVAGGQNTWALFV